MRGKFSERHEHEFYISNQLQFIKQQKIAIIRATVANLSVRGNYHLISLLSLLLILSCLRVLAFVYNV